MKQARNFSEILEEFTENESTTQRFDMSAGWESMLDPHGLAQVIGQTSVFKTGFKKYQSTFKRTPHSLTTEQRLAFENMLKWAPKLSDAFSNNELKSAYRHALLKTHPDHGGSAESFFAAKKSYEILRALVKS